MRLLPRFGMRSATHRQRWGTRGPTLSWVSRCAPAACGEGVTLRSPCQRCSTPTHSCSTRARRCSARRPHARAPPWAPSAWAPSTRAHTRASGTTVKIRPICNFSLILKFPFTPRIHFTTQSDCEVSSKVTVLYSVLQFVLFEYFSACTCLLYTSPSPRDS